MRDFKINLETGDVFIENGDFVIISDLEEIIQSYSNLLEQIAFKEEESDEGTIAEQLQLFKSKFAQNIERAKNATNKIQSLLSPLVQ